MDCTEIVRTKVSAVKLPLVVVRDDQARVTQEATIGVVSRGELDTRMARGVDVSWVAVLAVAFRHE
jgi:hypothetical protein